MRRSASHRSPSKRAAGSAAENNNPRRTSSSRPRRFSCRSDGTADADADAGKSADAGPEITPARHHSQGDAKSGRGGRSTVIKGSQRRPATAAARGIVTSTGNTVTDSQRSSRSAYRRTAHFQHRDWRARNDLRPSGHRSESRLPLPSSGSSTRSSLEGGAVQHDDDKRTNGE